MTQKTDKLQSVLPHSNYVEDSSSTSAAAAAADTTKTTKKTRIKRIKKFIKSHCNRSRIILFILFLIIVSAIITIILVLTRNPFALIRPLCKAQFGLPSLNQTFNYLAQLESNNVVDGESVSYNNVDSSGFTGKYKFNEIMLSKLGYYNLNHTFNGTNIWNGSWTGKNGCNNYSDFLNNKLNVQERAIREAYQYNLVIFSNKTLSYNQSLDTFWDKSFTFSSGCNAQTDGLIVSNLTLAGILTSSYLIGPENVSQALINGIAPCDNRTSTSLTRYFLDFAGCDFSPEDVNVSVSSFDINNPNKTRV